MKWALVKYLAISERYPAERMVLVGTYELDDDWMWTAMPAKDVREFPEYTHFCEMPAPPEREVTDANKS